MINNMSRSPKDIHQTIVDLCDSGRDFAVATVLQAVGSTPCKAGSKAIVDADGAILGTVGGGAVEAEAQRRAIEVIKIGRPAVFEFNLEGGAVKGDNPICGGTMRLLLDPTVAEYQAAYRAALLARQRRERGVLLTTIRVEREPEVEIRFFAERELSAECPFHDAKEIRPVLEKEETTLIVCQPSQEEQSFEVLVEPLIPNPLLVILGGGHIGQALAVQADLVGFDILVIDDRREFTDAGLFPEGAATRCGPIVEEINRLPIGNDTYIVIVTRGHQHDAEALAACLHKPAAYIGMIGSRRKEAMMRKEFIESGRATAAEFDGVYTPIGLDIGALTVPEIAASISAQLIAVRRKGTAQRISGK
jgi:xanthine dehydrogenase accessory factor